ncbi:MAG: DUF1761 domain-containing protein [Candidatus Harrisonbacteria bacterium CG10_big_fil_rev_8_21_14_0_10_42_17]|uniref:DUF1761 domain-containing protein n=1 Tax=Candidatus Harrisonbacteria bacterium CG10_big_fil_rev_8_21_14_0_10_42_17 TaxID=1974584 RepID=A0A2M6WH95_9BACT|nr:MAG: DUF1761 domain-containing protein [Candidatus Harrisonbacteria bacterium CG10_big_fil_rev_8_21_14_0_10_42_17]
MPEITINYWSILAAAIANMIVGMLWYGPLFGKQWKKLMGFSNDDMKKMKMTPMQAMIGGLITSLIMAYVLAHSAFMWNLFFAGSVSDFMFALQLAVWIWLGFVATTQISSVLWEGRPWKLFFLNASNTLVSLIAMAMILTFWK